MLAVATEEAAAAFVAVLRATERKGTVRCERLNLAHMATRSRVMRSPDAAVIAHSCRPARRSLSTVN